MPKDLKSKIAKKLVRKIAIRGAIALATGGAGLLLFEGLELALDAWEMTELARDALEAAELPITGIEETEIYQDVTEIMEGAEDINPPPEDINLLPEDPLQLLTFAAISASVFKIDIYFDKKNISLKEDVKKIIQENKKEEIQEINELERKMQKTSNQATKDSLAKKLREKIDAFGKEMTKDKKVSKAILASVLATYVSIQGQAVGDFIGQLEKENPDFTSKLKDNPELVADYLSNDKNYEKFIKDLEKKSLQEVNQGIAEASVERLKDFPVKINCSELDLNFECEGKNNNQVIVKAFRIQGEEILHLEGSNSEGTQNLEVVINLENYPNSLLSDIFQMCRCYREYQRLDNTNYGKKYSQFRQKTLAGWQSFRNV